MTEYMNVLQYYLLSEYCCIWTRTEIFDGHFSGLSSDRQIILER